MTELAAGGDPTPGPIPAQAGEPFGRDQRSLRRAEAISPRRRGNQGSALNVAATLRIGLSPRRRGNLHRGILTSCTSTISGLSPAQAGEPMHS